jgi:hypothetical protein
MKAAELHRLLAAGLGDWFKEHGFSKRKASRLVYQRGENDRYHTVWFQADHSGWDAHAGSSFFVNFAVTATPDHEGVERRDERLNFFLTDDELDIARHLNNAIVARIPRPPESYFQMMEEAARRSSPELGASIRGALLLSFQPAPMPYQRHQDFSLRYWQPRDIAEWIDFIRPVLPGAIEQMRAWSVTK